MKKKIIYVLTGMLLLVSLAMPSCGFEGDSMLDDLWTRNVYPGITNTYDIGSLTYQYNNGYFQNLFLNGAAVGVGDVVGTPPSTDHAIARYDGVTGLLIQSSLATVSDLGTISAPTVNAGNINSTGKVEADRLIGDIEGYSIDVVQASDLDIALNDTLVLTFLFEPDVIVVDYSSRCRHDTSFESGHTTGHSVITRTGVDTITYNTNSTSLIDNNGAIGSVGVQNNVANVIIAYGGNDVVDDSYFFGVGTWVSATHTLTITFGTVANTQTAFNFVEIVATAYQ